MAILKGLSKKTWMIIGGVAVAVLIIVIVVPVEVAKENAYPSYSAINYTLVDTYSGESFFDSFEYFTDTVSPLPALCACVRVCSGTMALTKHNAQDPTSGYVTYVDASTASSLNLTYATSSRAVLRVDTSDADDSDSSSDSSSSSTSSTSGSSSSSGQSSSSQGGQSSSSQGGQSSQQGGGPSRRDTTTTSSTGRNSVRVTSKNTYDSGLFIFDVRHTPHGCGTWPALWLTDVSNWPSNGEIDVMEAVNLADSGNQMTLHTASGCEMDHKRKQTGTTTYENCYWEANDESGCGVKGNDSTFGEDYNSAGGGYMALEWRSAGIRVWNFLRDSVPADITNNAPDPSTWGEATADFPNTGCDIDSHFKNQTIIINIDLCGSWAGGTAYTESSCKSNPPRNVPACSFFFFPCSFL